MKNHFLAFLLALLVVLTATSLRRTVTGTSGAGIAWAPTQVLATGGGPIPWPPAQVLATGGGPIPWPPAERSSVGR